MEFVIRPPHVDESEVLADLHLRTWAETYSEIFPSSAWDEEARAGRIRQWAALCTDPQPGWRTAVRPVGIAHVEGDAENRVLSFIYVLAEATAPAPDKRCWTPCWARTVRACGCSSRTPAPGPSIRGTTLRRPANGSQRGWAATRYVSVASSATASSSRCNNFCSVARKL